MIRLTLDDYTPQINGVGDIETYVNQLSGTIQTIVIRWPDITDDKALQNIRQSLSKAVNGFRDYRASLSQQTDGVKVIFDQPVDAKWAGVVLLRLYNLVSWASRVEVKLKSSTVFSIANFNSLTTEQVFVKA